MSEILVIQNTKNEGIATLGKLLEQDGFRITTVLAKKEEVPKIEPRAIIILGAPESANDDLQYLKEEMTLILESVKKRYQFLGFVLGHSLLQRHLGLKYIQARKKRLDFIMMLSLTTSQVPGYSEA